MKRRESYSGDVISVYVFNITSRLQSQKHNPFLGRAEFSVKNINIDEEKDIWIKLKSAITDSQLNGDDVIIICSDRHKFTKHYNSDFLFNNIIAAHTQGAGILSGGSYGFKNVFQITNNRFWIDEFEGFPFLVLYRKLFQSILDHDQDSNIVNLGTTLSELTSHKMLLYPFISKLVTEEIHKTNTSNLSEKFSKNLRQASLQLKMLSETKIKYMN